MLNSDFTMENGVLSAYIGADAHVVIPDAVSIIDDFTFEACMNLGKITIPRSVTSIGAYALGGRMRLRNIFYSGSAEERDRIRISASNKTLPFAAWRCVQRSTAEMCKKVRGK